MRLLKARNILRPRAEDIRFRVYYIDMKIFTRMEFGNPILRARAKPVASSFIQKSGFKNLVRQMFYTMHRAQGIGLAAPQIGLPLQLAVIQIGSRKNRFRAEPPERIVLINPKILKTSKEKSYDWEGCLSCMSIRGYVPRYRSIKVRYRDEKGEERVRAVSGFLARVFQHEIDHLDGKIYIDRMEDMKTLVTAREFEKRFRSY